MHTTSGGLIALQLALLLVGAARAEPGDVRLHLVDPATTAISGIRMAPEASVPC